MRLLNTNTIELQEFAENEIPPYAILSHTWGDGEVSLQELVGGRAAGKSGLQKIKQYCALAKSRGFAHVWIDTCCIDKTSSAELSEAINSMYQWYEEAAECHAYLADVVSESDLAGSQWCTRGWTLQELITPETIIFFNKDWEQLGTKQSLGESIWMCTRIPVGVLHGSRGVESFSVAQRMSWAATRKTTRAEDGAYCLMGLFAINMPLLYGEREREFIRLQEEIIKVIDDDSIFAWRCSYDSEGILASSPAGFLHSSHIVNDPAPGSFPSNPPTASSKGIHLEARFMGINIMGYGIVILDCKEEGGFAPLAIVVKDIFLNKAKFKRVASNLLVTVHMGTFAPRLYPIRKICVQKARLYWAPVGSISKPGTTWKVKIHCAPLLGLARRVLPGVCWSAGLQSELRRKQTERQYHMPPKWAIQTS